MSVNGEEDEDGKNILELWNKRHLTLSLRIENIGGGKTHLVADDRCPEFHRSEYQSGNQSEDQTKEELGDNEHQKGGRRKTEPGDSTLHERKEGERDCKYQGSFNPDGCLRREKNRYCADKSGNTAGYNEKCLKLINGNELDVHNDL